MEEDVEEEEEEEEEEDGERELDSAGVSCRDDTEGDWGMEMICSAPLEDGAAGEVLTADCKCTLSARTPASVIVKVEDVLSVAEAENSLSPSSFTREGEEDEGSLPPSDDFVLAPSRTEGRGARWAKR